jgi:predicted RNase H-like HicB family nuclease
MKESKEKLFSVVYEKSSEGGYVVSVPSLPGCYSQGESLEEAKKNIQEAIELYLDESGEEADNSKEEFIGTVLIHA